MRASTRDQLLAACLYFMQCLSLTPVGNFIAIYFQYRHLDLNQIGLLIGAVYPFTQLLGQPIWCYFADVTNKHKLFLCLSLFLGTGIIFTLLFMKSFLHLALVFGAGGFLSSGVNPMIDSATMACIEHHSLPMTRYGHLRVFGAVGWGVGALVIGAMVDHFGVPVLFYDFAAFSIFYFVAVLVFPYYSPTSNNSNSSNRESVNPLSTEINKGEGSSYAVVVDGNDEETTHLLRQPHDQQQNCDDRHSNRVGGCKRQNEQQTRSFLEVLKYLIGQETVLLFMVLLVVMGMMKGVIDAFQFLFLKDLGGSGTLLGVTLATTTISEFPFFAYSGNIIRKFGALTVVFMSMAAYSGRLLYYSRLTNPWLVLPIELLHGITFSLSWSTVVAHAQAVAPPGNKTTVQGLFSALFWGLGFGSGAIAGGFVSSAYGLDMLFSFSATFCASFIILGMCWYLVEKSCHKRQRPVKPSFT
eukprot:m.51346 g.51346  ORF g.51346 m.51346 type:complete len:469 (+) comp7559_c0_seq1:122-1528(+)